VRSKVGRKRLDGVSVISNFEFRISDLSARWKATGGLKYSARVRARSQEEENSDSVFPPPNRGQKSQATW